MVHFHKRCAWSNPFFLKSSASFRFFENVECHLCVFDSVINSRLYVPLKNLVVSNIDWQKQTQNFCWRVVHLKNSWFAQKFEINATTWHTVKCSLIRANSLKTAWKMHSGPLFLPVCWNRVCLNENRTLHHTFYDYFSLWVTLTTLAKPTISLENYGTEAFAHSFSSFQNILRDQVLENFDRWCRERTSRNSTVFQDNPCILPDCKTLMRELAGKLFPRCFVELHDSLTCFKIVNNSRKQLDNCFAGYTLISKYAKMIA